MVILAICPLVSMSDCFFSINQLNLIQKMIYKCDIKRIIKLPIKTITSDLKDSTYAITTGLAAIILTDDVCLDLRNERYSIFNFITLKRINNIFFLLICKYVIPLYKKC